MEHLREFGRQKRGPSSSPTCHRRAFCLAACAIANPLAALAWRHRSAYDRPSPKHKADRKGRDEHPEPPAPPAPKPSLLREHERPVAVLTLNRPAARNSLSEALLDRARRRARRASPPDTHRARRGARRQRPGVLRRPRSQGADRPAQRCRRRPRLFPADHDDLQRDDAADRRPAPAGDRRGAGRRHRRPAASWSRAATSRSPRRTQASPRPASISACSARRRWWRCRATWRASTRWRCCSPATIVGRRGRRHRPGQPSRAAGTERDAAIALARKIAAKSSHVVGIGKEAFYRQVELPLAEAYGYASEVMTENMMARDAEEGICAFIEKRDPEAGKTADDRDGGMNHDNYPD